MLIAAEPPSALDVTIQAQALNVISSLGRGLGMATVLITHDFGVVAGHADRAAVMFAWRTVEEAPRSSFLEPMHAIHDRVAPIRLATRHADRVSANASCRSRVCRGVLRAAR